jgi:peptide-methionine (S)-S-oxide reductase
VEVVKVSFDTDRITLAEVLEIFFHIHDPTTPNRQGNDVGTQYRSGIYWDDAEHEKIARQVWAETNAAHKGRVVTELKPLANYSKAEAYHQHYFARNPGQGYCVFVVAPKVEKFKKTFAARVKKG